MTADDAQRIEGFEPVWSADARLLILGSMPSVASLRQTRYYGHPRNAFWPIMGALVGAGPELDYPARLDRLRSRGIALWDVCGACRREGSADAAIRAVEANDLPGLIERTADLRAIACNGGKAHELLQRHFLRRGSDNFTALPVLRLPSTSPAHAARSPADKLEAWRSILDFLD